MPSSTSPDCLIRPAAPADLAAVLDIYNHAVLHSTATFDTEQRTLAAQRRWCRQFAPPYVLLVAERRGDILGWGCLHPFGGKPGYRYTTEDSVYVRADRRGDGIGRLLLAALLKAGAAGGFRTVIARITADNPVSLRLHSSFGFERVGCEREVGYKFERWLDVVVMQKMLQ